MDGPFRSAPVEAGTGAPRDDGIVGEVIRQFADPLAFYRELVQNSIDAGSPGVEVRLDYDAGAQLMRASVRDQGDGMDRDILENQLLVMFRSTKEKDPTKIGKFGIGFKSVLAPNPRAVVIATSRAGKKLTVHLYPDLSYELFDTGSARSNGTTVTVELAMDGEAAATFARDSRAALERWCRHATCPIRFEAPGVSARIDRPLGLDAPLVEVRGTADDGALTAVVGITERGVASAGFFNHGLTLYETDEEMIGGVSFVVQDSRLGHTLSRDNVRRDAAFDRAVAFARELAEEKLPKEMARALADAAGDRERYGRLFAAIQAAGIALDEATWVVPLVDTVGASDALALARLPGRTILAARTSSRLTAAFAEQGTPLVDLSAAGIDLRGVFAARLKEVSGRAVVDVGDEYVLLTPVEPTPEDEMMLERLHTYLDAVYRAPKSIALVTLDGAYATELAVSGEAGLVHVEHARRSPFTLLSRKPLALAVGHPWVAGARQRAATDPVSAAALLARVVLQQYRALDRGRSAELLARTLEELA